MFQRLTDGRPLTLEPSGRKCSVGELLGAGTQGEVYRAHIDGGGGGEVALKWYFARYRDADKTLRRRLEAAIADGSPGPGFLWPMELASAPDVDGFGYIMPLKSTNHVGLASVLSRQVEPTFRALATAGFNLCDNMLALHARGLCYRDINFDNILLDPESGDVLICDNDNVDIDGEAGAVLGTLIFLAPEILRRQCPPRAQTDLHALAVLLFYMFHMHHPLFGKRVLQFPCLNTMECAQLCAVDPLFIFDPNNTSNEALADNPDAGANAVACWRLFPQFFRDLFTRAFTDGLRDPVSGRVRESEWRRAMVELRDLIVNCSGCGCESFWDPRSPVSSTACWSCGAPCHVPPQLTIRVGGSPQVVLLGVGARLFPHHTSRQRRYDFSAPTGIVGGAGELQNVSGENWVVQYATGALADVPPGERVLPAQGMKLFFGTADGTIG